MLLVIRWVTFLHLPLSISAQVAFDLIPGLFVGHFVSGSTKSFWLCICLCSFLCVLPNTTSLHTLFPWIVIHIKDEAGSWQSSSCPQCRQRGNVNFSPSHSKTILNMPSTHKHVFVQNLADNILFKEYCAGKLHSLLPKKWKKRLLLIPPFC